MFDFIRDMAAFYRVFKQGKWKEITAEELIDASWNSDDSKYLFDLDWVLYYLLTKSDLRNCEDITKTDRVLEMITNTSEDEERVRQNKLLLNRFNKIEEGFGNNKFNEDYYLKTVYGLVRHLYQYKPEAVGGYLRDEVIMLYKLLLYIANESIAERTGDYGQCAKYATEQLNFDMVKYVCDGFPQGGYFKYDVYIGYNEHVPAGCSDLCTSIAGYEEFRGGIRDYDYLMAYEADPNDVFADPDGNIVPAPDFEEYDPFDYDNEIKAIYPSFEVDESDEEILDLFPEFDDYDSLNESGDD